MSLEVKVRSSLVALIAVVATVVTTPAIVEGFSLKETCCESISPYMARVQTAALKGEIAPREADWDVQHDIPLESSRSSIKIAVPILDIVKPTIDTAAYNEETRVVTNGQPKSTSGKSRIICCKSRFGLVWLPRGCFRCIIG